MFTPNNPKRIITAMCHSIGRSEYNKELLNRIVDINLQGLDGNTVLTIAVVNSNKELVNYLIDECNANIDGRNHDFTTPLHHAIYLESVDMIKLLLEKGADLQAYAPEPEVVDTPIACAFENGNKILIEILIEFLLDDDPDDIGFLYELAHRFNRIDLFEECIEDRL